MPHSVSLLNEVRVEESVDAGIPTVQIVTSHSILLPSSPHAVEELFLSG